MDPVTLYAPDGRSVVVRSARENTNLRASGYKDTPPDTVQVEVAGELRHETFDPAEHTVEQVQAFIKDHPDVAPSVIEAEKAGKNRTGITAG